MILPPKGNSNIMIYHKGLKDRVHAGRYNRKGVFR